ncbi:MAG: hypothetical protein J5849_03070 [Clostridia bacterium]|nr:hypothetical protein [Clostridia bacterium]
MTFKRLLSVLLALALLVSLSSCLDIGRFLPEESESDPASTDGSETGSGTETKSESEPESRSETEAATGSESESETAAETESESESGSGIDIFDDPEGYNPIIGAMSDLPPLLSPVQFCLRYGYESAEDEDGRMLATASWQELVPAPVTEANHPELARMIQKINENTKIAALHDLDELAEAGREYPVSDGAPYSAEYDVLVKRSDEIAVSLLVRRAVADQNGYSTEYDSYVLSPDTGEPMPITQMISSEEALLEAFVREFTVHYTNSYVSDPEATFGKVLSENKVPWVLEPTGLVFYMSPGTYADPGEGLLKINLPFGGNGEVYPGDVTDVPESYVIPFFPEETVLTPALNGGLTLDAWVTYDEYDAFFETLHVQTGGEQYDFEMEGIDADFFFVKTKTHKLFVVNSDQVGSHGDFTIFTLDEGRPVFYALLSGESLSGAYFSDDGYGDFIFTDPECFLLSSKIDTLSTYTGIRLFSFDEGIVPQPADPVYVISCDFKLTVKKDVSLDLVYTETRRPTGEKITVAAGTELAFVRTDRNTFVEMTDGNGLYVRVTFDNPGEYPLTVDGVPVDDIFDGIMYAN